MEKFEWKGFTPTPAEKHAGIAEVKIHGNIPMVVRFKIVSRKDGNGHFPNVASYKMPDRMPGEEYDECFMLDSRSDHDALVKFVMSHFSAWQKAQHPSVFTPQHAYNGMGQPPVQQAQSVPFVQRPEYAPSFPDMPPDFGNPPF